MASLLSSLRPSPNGPNPMSTYLPDMRGWGPSLLRGGSSRSSWDGDSLLTRSIMSGRTGIMSPSTLGTIMMSSKENCALSSIWNEWREIRAIWPLSYSQLPAQKCWQFSVKVPICIESLVPTLMRLNTSNKDVHKWINFEKNLFVVFSFMKNESFS